MQFVEKCVKCDTVIDVGISLKNKNFNKDGKTICLTYFDCPKCGERKFVQIDDETSLAMLDSVKKTFIRFACRKRRGKKIPRIENNRFEEARSRLSTYRFDLMQQFAGKVIYDEDNGNEYTLRFFV